MTRAQGRALGKTIFGMSFSDRSRLAPFKMVGKPNVDWTGEIVSGSEQSRIKPADSATLRKLALGGFRGIQEYEKGVKKSVREEEKLHRIAEQARARMNDPSGFKQGLTKKERYALAYEERKVDEDAALKEQIRLLGAIADNTAPLNTGEGEN
jgi:hypothetical protein